MRSGGCFSRWFWIGLFIGAGVLPSSPSLARYYENPPRLESLTPEQQQLLAKVQSLIEPTTEEKVMYHYGGAAPCQKLNEAGTYTGAIQEKYSRIRTQSRAVAGHGVYVAGNPTSSSNYYKGGITQVVLEAGTPMIDLTRPDVLRRMADLGLDSDDIYSLPVDAVVRYDAGHDWYAIKGSSGVRFQPVDVTRTSPEDLAQLLREVGTSTHHGAANVRLMQSALDELKSRKGDMSAAWTELGRGLPRTWSVLREFPIEARVKAVDARFAGRAVVDGFRASRVEWTSRLKEREAIRETGEWMLADINTRLAAGQELSLPELKRLIFASGIAGLPDWQLGEAVSQLSPDGRARLVELLNGLLDGYIPGRRTGYFPDPHGLEGMARLISKMGGLAGVTDGTPVPGVPQLAERYLTLMRTQFQRPATRLPDLPSGRSQGACRSMLQSTLRGLTGNVVPLAVGGGLLYLGVAGSRQNSDQSREEQIQHVEGLCTAGGGKFLRMDTQGPGTCDCGAGVKVTYKNWEDLPSAGDQIPLCARSQ